MRWYLDSTVVIIIHTKQKNHQFLGGFFVAVCPDAFWVGKPRRSVGTLFFVLFRSFGTPKYFYNGGYNFGSLPRVVRALGSHSDIAGRKFA